jgi:hypothetical protein
MSWVRIVVFIVAVLALTGMALGQEFWVKKDYTQWTEKEVQKIMTDSPWSKDVTVATAPPGGSSLDMGSGGGGGGGGEEEGGGGGGGGGGSRGGGGGRGGGGSNTVKLTISFRSAVPLKQAVVKSRMAAGGDVPADAKEFLGREETYYVVMASGLPQRMLRDARDPDELKKSQIKRGKKTPVAPADVQFQQGQRQTVDVLFLFPKTDPIVEADKEIEVILRLGKFDFKKKFALKDMVFNGKLEM